MAELDLDLAAWALDEARREGASAAEVLAVSGESLAAGVRMGKVEKLKSSRERRIGMRVFTGKSSATASTAEFDRDALKTFIADTVRLARLTAPDPFSGLPDPALHPKALAALDLSDSDAGMIDADRALEIARRAENAALGHDSRIVNSEGSEFESERHAMMLANSQGFCGEYSGTAYSLVTQPVAGDNGAMQLGFWYTANRRFERLEEAESVGVTAAKRALRRLGARKIKTVRAPVIFAPDMSPSLIRALAGAASGPALYRGASFLSGKLGERVASSAVTIIDDGTMVGGLGSRPFDGEGLATNCKNLVEAGVLKTYLLDSYSARRLKLAPTANATRGVGEAPGVGTMNLHLKPGIYTPEEIIKSVKSGLYLTEMIGFGVNLVTGDYSRGAGGMWIENGELAFPVQEVTIAGNLKDMLAGIEMVGNDLHWRSTTAAPTIRIAEMTIAGE